MVEFPSQRAPVRAQAAGGLGLRGLRCFLAPLVIKGVTGGDSLERSDRIPAGSQSEGCASHCSVAVI